MTVSDLFVDRVYLQTDFTLFVGWHRVHVYASHCVATRHCRASRRSKKTCSFEGLAAHWSRAQLCRCCKWLYAAFAL